VRRNNSTKEVYGASTHSTQISQFFKDVVGYLCYKRPPQH